MQFGRHEINFFDGRRNRRLVISAAVTTVFCLRSWACLVIAIGVTLLSCRPVQAQLPFYTDDADTTPQGKFHVELSTEFDWLQRSSLPGIRQNTSVFTLDYGLTNRIELGIDSPLI